MRKFISCASIMFALMACASYAYAHGGTYQGPAGGGTPGYSGPAGGGTLGPDPGNPDPGGGAGGRTPGSGGGATGGGGGRGTGPVRPGGRLPGGAGGGAGAAGGRTPGRKKSSGPSYENWDWWWDLNEERYLQLKNKVRASASASENRDTFLAPDIEEDVAEVTLRQIRESIEPTLKIGLKDPWYDARAGAAIGIGKIGNPDRDDLVDTLKTLANDEQKIVRESTCLALGILGNQTAIPFLLDVVRNKPSARKIFGREQKDLLDRTRTFAAVAIGLIGSRNGFDDASVTTELLSLVTKGDAANRDLQMGPALALGVVRSQEAIPQMVEILKDPEIDPYVRAHIATSLGKVGAKQATKTLIKHLGDKEAHIARSCAIALGLLASRDNKDIVNQLIRYADRASDRATRNFAIIALGQQGHPKGRAFLEKKAKSGKNIYDKTFSAIALGLYCFKFNEGREEIGDLLLKRYRSEKSNAEKGALAVALGLVNYQPSMEFIRSDLDRGGSQDLKGHLCTALGLMLDREAIPMIQKLVRQKGDTDLRKRAAIALGLMGDPGAVDVLQKVIQESGNSKAILGAATVALGFVGDRRAIPILTEMVENKDNRHQDVTRAFATVSLGFLGDKDPLPILSKVQENSNYLAQTSSLAELLAIL